jgi:1-acyl-sn-glycerol-3-phosphate acyltransferase
MRFFSCSKNKSYDFFSFIRAFWFWFSLSFLTFFWAIVLLSLYPIFFILGKHQNKCHHMATLWSQSIILINPFWKFRIIGKENLPKTEEPVVYVANHQSQMDILAIYLLGIQFRWIAKKSLQRIPFLGWSMFLIGYIFVDRKCKKSAEQCLKRASRKIKEGVSMLFFPEGTRSASGEVGRFKAGAFRLAVAEHVPVVPITIEGCHRLLPKGSWITQEAEVRIVVHPPISVSGLDASTASHTAREIIIKSLLTSD